MDPIHLDTSFLIRSLRQGSPEDLRLRKWLGAGQPLAMSTIAWAEFLCGPFLPEATPLAAEIVTELVAFGENEAEVTSMLFNQSGRRRGSMIDAMIAATALSQDAVLATSNLRDFERFEPHGLRLASR